MPINRRTLLTSTLGLLTAGFGSLRGGRVRAEERVRATPKVVKSKEEWKQRLSPESYHVLFEEGTERAGTSALLSEKRAGKFLCAACNLPLFDAATKYESGTGWPSFWDHLPEAVGTSTDYKLIYPRSEYHCTRCGGHQGHVFDDGPRPTGKRYCNNGVALRFAPEGEPLPALVE